MPVPARLLPDRAAKRRAGIAEDSRRAGVKDEGLCSNEYNMAGRSCQPNSAQILAIQANHAAVRLQQAQQQIGLVDSPRHSIRQSATVSPAARKKRCVRFRAPGRCDRNDKVTLRTPHAPRTRGRGGGRQELQSLRAPCRSNIWPTAPGRRARSPGWFIESHQRLNGRKTQAHGVGCERMNVRARFPRGAGPRRTPRTLGRRRSEDGAPVLAERN